MAPVPTAAQLVEAQIASKELSIKKLALTHANVTPLPDNTKTYAATGRMCGDAPSARR